MAPIPKIVYVDDAIHILQISEMDFYALIKAKQIELISAEMGDAISKDALLTLTESPEIPALVEKALQNQLVGREEDEASGRNKYFKEESAKMLIRYKAYIKTIEEIHRNYNDYFKPLFQQSPEAAAYILFARSISYLKMAIDSLQDQHFEAIVLLRPIDEAIALAEYFLIEKDSAEGKNNLLLWFRENRSPPYSICRDSIDKYFSSLPVVDNAPSIRFGNEKALSRQK